MFAALPPHEVSRYYTDITVFLQCDTSLKTLGEVIVELDEQMVSRRKAASWIGLSVFTLTLNGEEDLEEMGVGVWTWEFQSPHHDIVDMLLTS